MSKAFLCKIKEGTKLAKYDFYIFQVPVLFKRCLDAVECSLLKIVVVFFQFRIFFATLCALRHACNIRRDVHCLVRVSQRKNKGSEDKCFTRFMIEEFYSSFL